MEINNNLKKINIGVLALQGCVKPHRFHIESLGAIYTEVRTAEDLQAMHALILPGGESTTMLKLIHEFQLEQSLRDAFQIMPVWGICAGAILMAQNVYVATRRQKSFGLLDITIHRNAYGSQIHSFNTEIQDTPVSFIRAPIIQNVGSNIEVKAWHNNLPVWVQAGRFMATSFHPELFTHVPSKMHAAFIELVSHDVHQC